MKKFLIKKLLIPNIHLHKHNDYKSRQNSSISQDSCFIIIIFFFCDIILNFVIEHPEKIF